MKFDCEICGTELSEGTGSKGGPMLCPGCRSSSYYWHKRELGAVRARYEALSLYRTRMEYYEPRVLQLINNAKRAVNGGKQRARAALTN